MGDGKPGVLCHLPDLLLGIRPYGHQRVRQLVLGQRIERVGLILSGRHRIADAETAVFQPVDPGVMAGGDVLRSNGQTLVQQSLPLHVPVTGNTGIRRSSMQILLHEIIHHVLPEFSFKIHHIIGNAQMIRHSPGVLHRAQAAAARILPAVIRALPLPGSGTGTVLLCLAPFVLPDLHGDTDHLISLLL